MIWGCQKSSVMFLMTSSWSGTSIMSKVYVALTWPPGESGREWNLGDGQNPNGLIFFFVDSHITTNPARHERETRRTPRSYRVCAYIRTCSDVFLTCACCLFSVCYIHSSFILKDYVQWTPRRVELRSFDASRGRRRFHLFQFSTSLQLTRATLWFASEVFWECRRDPL